MTSDVTIAAFPLGQNSSHVGFHHVAHQRVKACSVPPPELGSRFARISEQRIYFGRPKIAWIDLHQRLSGRLVEALLLDAASLPDNRPADVSEGRFDEFTHRVCLAGGKNIIVWLVLLQDEPHSLDKIARVAPVAYCVEVPEKQFLLKPAIDRGDGARDLAGNKGLAPNGALVIEQNPVRGMHPIGLTVVDRDPMGIKLCGRIGRARIEWSRLLLRDLLGLAEQFGRGRLIETGLLFPAEDTD